MSIDISTFPIEQWPIENIKPYPYNNKKHPTKHIEMLAKSIESQGHLDPIAIDEDGVIISGHGRHLALQKLDRKIAMVRVLKGLTEEQKSALRIAANKTVSTDYDTDMLQRELNALAAVDFDMTSLGLDPKELDMMLTDIGNIDEDSITLDIDGAVETHEADVADKAAAMDDDTVRLDKAFGFKSLPLRDQKTVTRFLAVAEEQTGLTGADALLEHMRQVLKAA